MVYTQYEGTEATAHLPCMFVLFTRGFGSTNYVFTEKILGITQKDS